MIIRAENSGYDYDVRIHQTGDKVHLGLTMQNEFARQLTRQEAKRVAYALLLAADGIEP